MHDPQFRRRPVWQTTLGTGILAGLFAAIWIWSGVKTHPPGPELAMSALLGIVLLGLSAVDLDRFLLPDAGTLPLIVVGICWTGLVQGALLQSTLGAVTGYALVAGLAWFWRRFRAREGIGLGDAKLLAALGAWLGIVHLPILLTIASGLGLLALLGVRIATPVREIDAPLPFGPFLALAGWVLWCAPIYSVSG